MHWTERKFDFSWAKTVKSFQPGRIIDINPEFGKNIKKSLTKKQITLQIVTFLAEDMVHPPYTPNGGIELAQAKIGQFKMQRVNSAELLEQYTSGQRNFEYLDLSENNWFEANLREANFTGSNLTRVYMPYANLSQVSFRQSQLTHAELSDAKLGQSDLTNANLICANLCRANLRNATLRRANLSGANLTKVDLSNADLSDANLSNADLTGANLSKANLSNANLSGANFFRARKVDFTDACSDKTTIYPDGYRKHDELGWISLLNLLLLVAGY